MLKELVDAKGVMRRAAYDARNAQPDKDAVSQSAIARLLQLPEYCEAQTVLWYLDCRSELRTRHVYELRLKNLAPGGGVFHPDEAHYTLKQIPEGK